MLKKLFIFSVLLALLVGVSAAVPPNPNAFYGTVKIAGSPAPVGTEIVAKVFNANHGQITTTESGKYGGTDTFSQKLEVSLTESEYTGCCQSCGCTLQIVFYINGKMADQTSTFDPGPLHRRLHPRLVLRPPQQQFHRQLSRQPHRQLSRRQMRHPGRHLYPSCPTASMGPYSCRTELRLMQGPTLRLLCRVLSIQTRIRSPS
jgi:hypothetical protein